MSDYPPGMKLRPIEAWPGPATTDRRPAPFAASHRSTLKLLDRELRLIDDHHLYPPTVLQIAMRERDFRVTDGMPKTNSRADHPGIILSVEPHDAPPLSFPCDTFTTWQDNLRAIALGMEALRKLDRYGITRDRQQYRGWQAIEPPRATSQMQFTIGTAEHYIRGLSPDAGDGLDLGTLPQVYRRAQGAAHPDRNGGDRTQWNRVEEAGQVLRAAGRL